MASPDELPIAVLLIGLLVAAVLAWSVVTLQMRRDGGEPSFG